MKSNKAEISVIISLNYYAIISLISMYLIYAIIYIIYAVIITITFNINKMIKKKSSYCNGGKEEVS